MRRFRRVLLVWTCLLVLLGCTEGGVLMPVAPAKTDFGDPAVPPQMPEDPSALIFDGDDVPLFEIELSEASVQALQWEPFTYVEGAFVWQGRRLEPVGIRLKGQSSFVPLDGAGKAAFKVKFDHYVDGGEFLGLDRLTLNNMVWDPSMIHERLAYEYFRDNGVPAPRCRHAWVVVNGQDFGLYSNVESVDRRFIERWFDDAGGSGFEMWDIDFYDAYVDGFELEYGADDRATIQALTDALELEPSPVAVQEASAYVDYQAFRRFWAASAVIGHFDGYPFHPDDVHLYDDPTSGQLWFIPWGTDESLVFEWDDYPDFTGIVAARCMDDPDCLQAWALELLQLADALPDSGLQETLDRVRDQLQPLIEEDPRRPYSAWEVEASQDAVEDYLAGRPEQIHDLVYGE